MGKWENLGGIAFVGLTIRMHCVFDYLVSGKYCVEIVIVVHEKARVMERTQT